MALEAHFLGWICSARGAGLLCAGYFFAFFSWLSLKKLAIIQGFAEYPEWGPHQNGLPPPFWRGEVGPP